MNAPVAGSDSARVSFSRITLIACGSQHSVVSVAPAAPIKSMGHPKVMHQPYADSACARFSVSFDCGLSAECWCAAEPYRLPMTKAWIEDCLCPECLHKAADALAQSRRDAEQGG